MRRREFIGLVGGAAAWPSSARGQQAAVRVIGVLALGSLAGSRAALAPAQRRLAEIGYIEGQNLAFEYRAADNQEDRLATLVGDLVQRRVSVIVATAGPPIVAAKAATISIPIVFFTGFDPVASGFVASLNRPGGNVTGIAVLNTEVQAKRLELLRELVPGAKSIAFLHSSTNLVPGYDLIGKDMQSAADTLGVELLFVEASRPDDFEGAFARIVSAHADALLVSADAFMFSNQAALVDLAAQHKIPAVYPIREFAARGGLASYGTDYREAYRQVGDYIGRVLNGEKPENLPVQQVTKLQLVINTKTAKALGLAVPPTLLARADEVIE
jgi:putative tryptophan/tyrosine transport system substrate-binding protein